MVNAKMRGNDEHFLHRWFGEDSVERGELDYNQMLSIMMLRLMMMLRFRLMYELIPFREERWWWCLWLRWGWRNWPVPPRRSWWGSSWGRRGRRRRTSRCGSCDVSIVVPLTRRDIFLQIVSSMFLFLVMSHFDRHLKVRYVLSARRRARKESV